MTRPFHSTPEHSLGFSDLPTKGSEALASTPGACGTHDDPGRP